LPLAVTAAGQPGSFPQHADKRVLLVEDDPASASAMSGILKRYGLSVLTTGTVHGALAALSDGGRYDYVILDLMLPDGDGAEVLRQLRQTQSNAWICVITAASDPTMLAAVQKLKPACVLRKPIDVGQLLGGMKLTQ
jgi:DNA-binding response OmpR family regulator